MIAVFTLIITTFTLIIEFIKICLEFKREKEQYEAFLDYHINALRAETHSSIDEAKHTLAVSYLAGHFNLEKDAMTFGIRNFKGLRKFLDKQYPGCFNLQSIH